MTLSDALILLVSQLQTQQVMMTSHIITHIIFITDIIYSCAHLLQIYYYILVLIL